MVAMIRVPFSFALASVLWLAGASGAYAQQLSFSTLAGYAGQGNTDGTGGNARFYNPSSVAVDSAGNGLRR